MLARVIGAIFLVATLLMRTMVPLRIANIIGSAFFAAFGALAGDVRILLLYFLMIPINGIRLRQMLSLVKKARVAAQGDLSTKWQWFWFKPRRLTRDLV
jgi:hypothetical protein